MFKFIRQSTQQLRPWLVAAAAILLFVSVLEAGHVHGVFTEVDDNCTLCQHSVALDKVLSSGIAVVVHFFLAIFVIAYTDTFFTRFKNHFALIRAPPSQLHIR